MNIVNNFEVRRGSRGDLRAETIVQLGNRRELLLSTRKHFRGGLVCDATVSQLSEDGKFRSHAIGMGVPGCGDFSTTVARAPDKRCTEKAVTEMHFLALGQLADITATAIAYYEAKDAEKAAKEAA